MEITYDLRSWFEPSTSLVDNARALRALLDCLISLNSAYLADHAVRPLYRSGVVYGRTTIWDPIPALYKRRYGDCKSLSAALIAEYRKAGKACEPCFRWIPRYQDGVLVRDFHILVETGHGYEDPSKILGMGADEVAPMTSIHDISLAGELSPAGRARQSNWLAKLGLK